MEYKNYYQIMGLDKSASADEIKRAYRKLARKYHPDVSKEADAEEKFKELAQAYEVLKDDEKRQQYDQLSEQINQQGPSFDDSQWQQQSNSQYQDNADFESFLNELFKQRQQQSYHYDGGQDIHAKLSVELEDVFAGSKKAFQLQVPQYDGNTMSYQTKTIEVTIPKGISDKQQIRLKGQGAQMPQGKCGDLYLEICINPHPLYKLAGKDLELNVAITPWEAALGGAIEVPTLTGTVKLTLPANTPAGKKLRLKGRGLPAKNPGDLYVKTEIVMPPTTNDAMKAAYEQLAQHCDYNPRQHLGATHA